MHVGTTRCETIWHPKKIQSQVQIGITERYESGESVLSAQVNSVKGVYPDHTAAQAFQRGGGKAEPLHG